MAKIVSKRYLKNNKTINVLAHKEKYEDLEEYGITFRHLKPSSNVKKVSSPRFLQEITLEDGSRVRVYAKNPEQLEEVKKAIASGEIKINLTDSKKPEVLSSSSEVVESEATLQFTHVNTGFIKTETNSKYIDDLLSRKKIQPLEGETPKSGYRVVEVPVEGTDQTVKYQASMEVANEFEDKVKNGEIKLESLEKVDEPDLIEDEAPVVEPKPEEVAGPAPKPEEPKPEEVVDPTKKPEEIVDVTPAPKPKPEDTSKKGPEEEKTPETTKTPEIPKKKHHILRKILQVAAVVGMVAVGIASMPFTGGLGLAPAVVGAVFAGRGFKKSNEKLEKKEEAQRMNKIVSASMEDESALENLNEEERLRAEMEIEQRKISELNRRKIIATKRREREALEAEVEELEK